MASAGAAEQRRGARAGRGRRRGAGSSDGSRRAGTRASPSAGSSADPAPRRARTAPSGCGHGARVLVGARRPARRPAATRSARRSRAAPARQRARRAPGRARGRAASRPARVASPRGTSSPSTPVRRRRRGSRRCRRPRPACPAANASVSTIPNDSPPSDGAHSTSAARSARSLARVVDAAERGHALALDQQRRELLGGRADHGQLGRDLRRAAPRRRAAARAGPCARRPGRRTRSAAARRARARAARGTPPSGSDDAVRDHPVAAAVEAPAGPGGGLGHRDPHVQVVELAPRAEQRARPCAAGPTPNSSGTCPTSGASALVSASQPTTGATGSWTWTTSKPPGAQLAAQRRDAATACPRGWTRRRWTASRSSRPAAPATRARSRT